jgi:hypothetical protein
MNRDDDLELRLRAWMGDRAVQRAPADLVDGALSRTLRVRQRPGYLVRSGGAARASLPVGIRLVLVGLLLLAMAGAAVLVGSRLLAPPPAPLHGFIAPTGSLVEDLFHPQAALLPDGAVLVVGTTADKYLDVETYDPGQGSFSRVTLRERLRSNGGEIGLVRLADGSVLLVASKWENNDGTTGGGFALRYDPVKKSIRRSSGLRSTGGAAADYADWGFASRPATVLPDGRARWDSVIPWSRPSVVYDPATDTFSTLPASGQPPPDRVPAQVSVRLADGRYLLLGGSPDEGGRVAIYDAATGVAKTLPTSLVDGGPYSGTLLPDGRVLVLGTSTGIFDPRTERLEDIAIPESFQFRLWLPDGRALLQSDDQVMSSGAHGGSHAWTFDPSTDTFARVGTADVTGATSWTLLADGRVLLVGVDPAHLADVVGRSAWILH